MSMSPSIRSYIGVLLAILIVGHGFRPKQLPRPVVKTITLQPPATRPVTLGGSKPGVSIKTNPLFVIGSAYSYTSVIAVDPALAIAPSDFSAIVVSPPSLLPTDGLLSISTP